MSITRGARTLATAGLLLVALAACSDDEPKSSPSTLAPTTATTATTPPTESQLATANAEAKIREYYGTLSRIRQDSSVPIAQLKTIAISTELTSLQHLVRKERREGRRQVGDTKIADLTIESVNLDNSDPQAGKAPTVVVSVCWDVSGVDVVDKGGKSVVVADRPDTGWTRHFVANYDWSKNPDGAWRVAGGEDLEKTPCSPAA